MRCAFPLHWQLLPLDNQIALRRCEGGEAQAVALANVGAGPSAIMCRHSADGLRKKTRSSPFAAGVLASELRAWDLQPRSAQLLRHRVLWITNGKPPATGARPVSSRADKRRAASPNKHCQDQGQAQT